MTWVVAELKRKEQEMEMKALTAAAIPGATKHDGGKLDLTFCPPEAIAAIARVMEFGALKYARGGWKHVPDGQTRYLKAAFRHMIQHLSEQTIDAETSLAHLDQALCNLAFHAALRYAGRPEAFQGYLEFTGQTLEQAQAKIAAFKKGKP